MDLHGEFVAGLITHAVKGYAAGVVERQLQIQPDVFERYGSQGFQDLAGDTQIRLLELADALAAATPELFAERIAALKVAFTARGVPLEWLRANLQCIGEELAASLPAGKADSAIEYVQQALAGLDSAPAELPSLLAQGAQVDLARRYLLAVLETRRDDAIEMILRAFEEGLSVPAIHRDVIRKAQAEIGRMWQMAEIHVAEEHYATEVTAQVLAQLRAVMPRAESNGRRVLCTAVGGDLHDIGLQMVADAFEMAGWQAIRLGASTPTVDLIHALRDFAADLLAVSTMVATQIRSTADLIRAVREHGGRPDLPILVGGAPFSRFPELWRAVGADGYGRDAAHAVTVGEQLVA
ncbi:MAG: cobalamin B12-binding domain-containing protein [Planctomycetota bacterium]|jgi:methylmalonyl-CoA mutase cobalamin-binding domain/chain